MVPSAVVSGRVGRSSSFEVQVDGKLAFSKLGVGAFPDPTSFAESLIKYAETGKAPEGEWCAPSEEGGCSIM